MHNMARANSLNTPLYITLLFIPVRISNNNANSTKMTQLLTSCIVVNGVCRTIIRINIASTVMTSSILKSKCSTQPAFLFLYMLSITSFHQKNQNYFFYYNSQYSHCQLKKQTLFTVFMSCFYISGHKNILDKNIYNVILIEDAFLVHFYFVLPC